MAKRVTGGGITGEALTGTKPAGLAQAEPLRKSKSIRFSAEELAKVTEVQRRIAAAKGGSDFGEALRFLLHAGYAALEQGAVSIEIETKAIAGVKMP